MDYSAHFGKTIVKQTSLDQFRKRVEPPQVTKDADYIAQSESFDKLVLSHFPNEHLVETGIRKIDALEALAFKSAEHHSPQPVKPSPLPNWKPVEGRLMTTQQLVAPDQPKERINLLDILDESSEESPAKPGPKWQPGITLGKAHRDEIDDLLADI